MNRYVFLVRSLPLWRHPPDALCQMTQYGDTVFNPDMRAFQRMEKTFFHQRQQLAIDQPKEILGEFAYFDFAVHIPDHDQFVPAGTSERSEDAEPKPLPPSMLVQPPMSLKPIGYSTYVLLSALWVLIGFLCRPILCRNTRPNSREARPDVHVSKQSFPPYFLDADTSADMPSLSCSFP